MDIQKPKPAGRGSTFNRIGPVTRPKRSRAPSQRRRCPDIAKWIRKARELPPVRKELIEKIKDQIAAGEYETPEKLDTAIERLLEDIS